MGVEPTTFWVQIRCSSQTELRPQIYWRIRVLLELLRRIVFLARLTKYTALNMLIHDKSAFCRYKKSRIILTFNIFAGIDGFEPSTNRLTVYCATAAPYPRISWGGGNRTPILGTKILCLAVRRRLNSKFIVLTTFGAEDEARTRNFQLGRLTLYQLSYFRKINHCL